MACVSGEKRTLLRGRKPAAHHDHALAREELTVAGGTVGDPAPAELRLALKANLTRRGTGCHEHREAAQIPLAGVDDLNVAAHLEARHLGKAELGAKGLRLPAHGVREFRTRGAEDAGVVDDLARDGDLTAKAVPLHDDDPVAGAGQIEGGGEPGWPTADHDGVVEVALVRHPTAVPRGRGRA